MKSSIRISTIGRSGSHGILLPLINKLDGKICFLNNIPTKDSIKRNIDNFDGRIYDLVPHKRLSLFEENFRERNNCGFGSNVIEHWNKVLDKQLLNKPNKSESWIVYGYENRFLEEIQKDFLFENTSYRYDIIIVRDAFNHFASLYALNGLPLRK
ncbi:MAG: hypothetical protein GF350_16720, partial [Chitinivibrionales bacterium]|nr:hypothetical protein [Chitinivibrionales bacterium]